MLGWPLATPLALPTATKAWGSGSGRGYGSLAGLSASLVATYGRQSLQASAGAVSTPLQDWINRSTAAGVVQAIRPNTQAIAAAWRHADTPSAANVNLWPDDGIVGDGCLQIAIEPTDGENSGAWRIPANSSWTVDGQGFGTALWRLQFRVKFGPHRFTVDTGISGAAHGFKILNIAEYRPQSPASSRSHPDGEIVVEQIEETSGVPLVYTDNGGTGLPNTGSAKYFETDGFPTGGDIRHQDALDNGSGIADKFARYCLYDAGAFDGSGVSAGCWRWVENQWYTIGMEIRIQSIGADTTGNLMQLQIGKDSDAAPTVLYNHGGMIMAQDSALPNNLNGLWFLPFKTNRSSGSLPSFHRYDEIIVSTNPIAWPTPRTLPSWVPTTLLAWAQIPNSNLSSAPRAVAGLGSDGTGQTKVDAWNGWAFDFRRNIVYPAGCGGHNNYGGNEVNKLTLGEVPEWTEPLAGSPTNQYSANGVGWQYYNDGRPASQHTGYGEIFDPFFGTNGRVMRIGGSRWHDGGDATQFDYYNCDTNAWAAAGTMPDRPAAGAGFLAFCRDPRNGNVYMFGTSGQVRRWNYVTSGGSWTSLADVSLDGYRMATAYDSLRNRIFCLGGGNTANHSTYDIAAGTATVRTVTGAPTGSADLGMVYVPGLDCYLVRDTAAGGAIFKIDAGTFVVTNLSTTGGGSIPATVGGGGGGGYFTRFIYAPLLKSVLIFPQFASNGWVLRVEA